MNGWLLDTDVISELRRADRNSQVRIWSDVQPQDRLFLSVVSIAEIRFGAERAASATLRRQLEEWLDAGIRQWLGGRVLSIDENTMFEWLRLVESGRRVGYTFAQPDLFLAASARLHNLCIVTRNVAHFTRAEVAIFDPWQNMLELPGRKPAKVNGVMTLDRLR